MASLASDLLSTRSEQDQVEKDRSRVSAQAAALEVELRASAKSLAETREGFDSEELKVACLERDAAELKVKMEADVKAAVAAALASGRKDCEALQNKVGAEKSAGTEGRTGVVRWGGFIFVGWSGYFV